MNYKEHGFEVASRNGNKVVLRPIKKSSESAGGLTILRESAAPEKPAEGPTEQQLDVWIQQSFEALGLSESAAAIAAAGRGCRPRSRAELTATTEDGRLDAIIEADLRALTGLVRPLKEAA
jgi:hypothetical protein